MLRPGWWACRRKHRRCAFGRSRRDWSPASEELAELPSLVGKPVAASWVPESSANRQAILPLQDATGLRGMLNTDHLGHRVSATQRHVRGHARRERCAYRAGSDRSWALTNELEYIHVSFRKEASCWTSTKSSLTHSRVPRAQLSQHAQCWTGVANTHVNVRASQTPLRPRGA